MANKGTSYEREVCKKLSLWWSIGQDDFVFWRTHGSGGRATSRARKGLKSAGHCGDVSAVGQVGKEFVELITVELKRGYNHVTVSDLLDCGKFAGKPTGSRGQRAQHFIAQAKAAAERAGTPYWMIVHRRDKRADLCWIPARIARVMTTCADVHYMEVPYKSSKIVVCRFDDFLRVMRPESVKGLARRLKLG